MTVQRTNLIAALAALAVLAVLVCASFVVGAGAAEHYRAEPAAHIVTLQDVLDDSDAAARNLSAGAGISAEDHLFFRAGSDEVVYAFIDPATLVKRIEILNVVNGKRRTLVAGWQPLPSPDGKRIAFIAQDKAGNAQIWTLLPTGTDVQQLTRFPEGLHCVYNTVYCQFAWSPDNRKMVVADMVGHSQASKDGSLTLKSADGMPAVERLGFGDTSQRADLQSDLWLIDVASGASQRILSEPVKSIWSLQWFADNRRVAYNWFTFDPGGDFCGNTRIVDVTSKTVRNLTTDNMTQDPFPLPSPDGNQVLVHRNRIPTFYPMWAEVTLVDVDSGESHMLAALPRTASSHAVAWRPQGDAFYADVTSDSGLKATRALKLLDLQGNVRASLPIETSARYIAFSSNMRKVTWITTESAATQLHLAELDDHGTKLSRARVLLSSPKAGQAKRTDFRYGERRLIDWKSSDGMDNRGYLVLPVDYQQGQRYPTLVLLHGGPQISRHNEGDPFPLDSSLMFDYWAGKGYAVLAPSYRADGVGGWEPIFAARERGDTLNGDLDDIMSGVDTLIEMGIADPQRLGIGGHSWGAVETGWVVTHAHRFKAAVAYNGMVDPERMWNNKGSGNRSVEWLYGGPPYEQQAKYDGQSPLRAVKGVTTPTLFIAGEADGSKDHLSAMFAGWQGQKVPAGYLLYLKEGHVLERRANQRDLLESVTEWFDRFINLGAAPEKKMPVSGKSNY